MDFSTRWSTQAPGSAASRLICLTTVILALAACGQEPDRSPNTSGGSQAATEIAWYEGDVDSAFALAKRQGKPLFLYWGAEWCPPCHYLKKKIFTRPEFIARMQDFVPVYLDGDTERAQILGEELEVMGYPTVIIFDSLGQEVMRMPSTVPVDQYDTVLDSAVATMKPVKTVLEEVLAEGPATASHQDLNLLAFYSWGQDSLVNLELGQQVDTFDSLYRETPEELTIERSRFLGLYLTSLADLARHDQAQTSSLSESQRAELTAAVIDVLTDPRLRNSNLLWVLYYADPLSNLLQPESSTAREQLLTTWSETADALEMDGSLSVGDRLNATRLKLQLARLADAGSDLESYAVSPELQEHARQRARWAMETVTDESELQSVVNTLAYVLKGAGLTDETEAMLLEKMNDTVAPYYFMSWIASLRAEAGDADGALAWYRKAYDASVGRYSRFRWGSTYLRRLMDLAPEGVERIEADSVEVLSELLSHDDAFAGGNHSRLASLESAYRQWNEEATYDAELARIQQFVRSSCERYPASGEDSQRSRCESFLAEQENRSETSL